MHRQKPLVDLKGRELSVGDHVVVGFSGRGSIGLLRLAVIKRINPNDIGVIVVIWDDTHKDSPPLRYKNKERWLILDES